MMHFSAFLDSDCGQAVFPNCQSFAPPVDEKTIKINMSLSSLSFDPILVKIHVQWEIPRAGNASLNGLDIVHSIPIIS